MNRDFEAELMIALNAFGLILQAALPIRVNIPAIAKQSATIAQGCNKLNQLIGDQQGIIPDTTRLMMENWVDSFYAASVMSAIVDSSSQADEREAAMNSYTYLMAQCLALYTLLADMQSHGREHPLSE